MLERKRSLSNSFWNFIGNLIRNLIRRSLIRNSIRNSINFIRNFIKINNAKRKQKKITKFKTVLTKPSIIGRIKRLPTSISRSQAFTSEETFSVNLLFNWGYFNKFDDCYLPHQTLPRMYQECRDWSNKSRQHWILASQNRTLPKQSMKKPEPVADLYNWKECHLNKLLFNFKIS